ncbi:MAG: hypothetical protein HKN26_17155 [Acidimicrobiales bacterium]|nr:hypothetical protein [Acidimicrobiales bacterium]
MLDHIFSDVISSLREVIESVGLERTVVDERFQSDILLGDLTWSSSYALPGESTPARARLDLTAQWTAAAQAAYRQWVDGDDPPTSPTIALDVAFRLQEQPEPPDVAALHQTLPIDSPPLGDDTLRRADPTIETIYGADLTAAPSYAYEVAYEGTLALSEADLTGGPELDDRLTALGGWAAGLLAQLS